METAALNTPFIPIGGRLGNNTYLNRWSAIKGYMLAKKGIIPIFINKGKAYNFWRKYKRDYFYVSNQKMQTIHDNMILDLLKNNTIEEVARLQLVWINLINLVRKANGKYRLVIDTRLVNCFLKKIYFKMEGIPTLIDLWERNDWAVSFDLKDAYNHIPVHPTMRPMLGIAWNNRYFSI
jgi:hypothetical protein